MKLIALTGGIGCGKSTVLNFFENLYSWNVVGADNICHELYTEKDSALCRALTGRWGKDVLAEDGSVNRSFLARQVFDRQDGIDELNKLTHPVIRDRIQKKIESFPEHANVMLDIPLLFESGWTDIAEKTVVVWSSPEIQWKRLENRGWTSEHIRKRLESQMSAAKKLELADFGIINNGSLEQLREQCGRLNEDLCKS